MEIPALFVPAAYAAALAWAIGRDFLRAQLDKDLEQDPPAVLLRALQTISLPTVCLVGALVLRMLIHVKGLLLSALVVAIALSIWKTSRLSMLRPAARRPIH